MRTNKRDRVPPKPPDPPPQGIRRDNTFDDQLFAEIIKTLGISESDPELMAIARELTTLWSLAPKIARKIERNLFIYLNKVEGGR